MHENNRQLATLFRSMADLLATQRANPYRVRAYRHAADSLLGLEEDVAAVAQRHGLEEIEGIGKDLAAKIREFLETGTIRAYEELKTPLPPEVKEWVKLPGLSDSASGRWPTWSNLSAPISFAHCLDFQGPKSSYSKLFSNCKHV
jgi:DNA polymerase (family 10)